MWVRIIVNPIAGRGRSLRRARRLEQFLRARGASVELLLTQKKGDAEKMAGLAGPDCVVAVGGDGTVNEVANGLGSTPKPMAILPVGTANAVARELGTPSSPESLGELILGRRIRRVDVGRVGQKRFLLCAGAGPDAAVVHEVHAHRRGKQGLAAYFLPTLPTLMKYGFPSFHLVLDHERILENVQYAVAANCRFSAGVFPVAGEACVDDGLLDIVAFRELSIFKLACYATRSFYRSLAHVPGVVYEKAKHAHFDAPENVVPFQVDGDPSGFLPAKVELEPLSLALFAP